VLKAERRCEASRSKKPWPKHSNTSPQGYGWVVDLGLEKFFDRVSHDKLMGQIAKRVEDKRLLNLIWAFLNAGGMENGLVSPSVEGTPQGGPAFTGAVQPRARRTRPTRTPLPALGR
jgi:retron-type reverse transcriptase